MLFGAPGCGKGTQGPKIVETPGAAFWEVFGYVFVHGLSDQKTIGRLKNYVQPLSVSPAFGQILVK